MTACHREWLLVSWLYKVPLTPVLISKTLSFHNNTWLELNIHIANEETKLSVVLAK